VNYLQEHFYKTKGNLNQIHSISLSLSLSKKKLYYGKKLILKISFLNLNKICTAADLMETRWMPHLQLQFSPSACCQNSLFPELLCQGQLVSTTFRKRWKSTLFFEVKGPFRIHVPIFNSFFHRIPPHPSHPTPMSFLRPWRYFTCNI
jgi:hypothetical protein